MEASPELSVLNGGPKQYPASIYSGLESSFRQRPDALAIISAHQSKDHLAAVVGNAATRVPEDDPSCLAWSYEQLERGAIRLTAAFDRAGLQKDAVVMSLLPNGADFWLVHFATTVYNKFTTASIDTGTLTEPRADQLQHFIRKLKPRVIVIADNKAAQAVDKVLDMPGIIKLTANWDGATPEDGWQTLDSFAMPVKSEQQERILEDARKDDFDRTSFIVFTSGTSSGRPKGCPRSVISVIHSLDTVQRSWSEKPARRLIDTANFRVIVFVTSMTTWAEGGCLVMSSTSFDPSKVLSVIEEMQITDTLLIPAQARILTATPGYDPARLKSVRTVATGGDVVTRSTLDLLSRMLPNGQSYAGHGMTEGSNFVGWDFVEPQKYYGEIASVGTVRKGVIMKVVGLDGKPTKRGQPGELHIDSYTTVRRYLDNVSADTFYSDEHGNWMKTGDTALFTAEGHIFILGRIKDIIKRSGVPITPAALESCLQAYTGSEVAVLGTPHPIYGAEPFAVLGSYGDKTAESVKRQVIDIFGKDYALGGVVSLQQLGMERFPMNASGKIQKLDLETALQMRPELQADIQYNRGSA